MCPSVGSPGPGISSHHQHSPPGQAGTACSPQECFLARGKSASLGSGRDLHRQQLGTPPSLGGHHFSSTPPARLAPCHRPPPGSPRAGRPPAPRPPPRSRCFQGDLGPPEAALPQKRLYCGLPRRAGGLLGWHTSVVLAVASGWGGCPSPGVFCGAVVFMGTQREEQAVLGLQRPARCRTPRSDTTTPQRDPGAQERAAPSLVAQDPPWLPPAPRLRSAWGCLSPLPPGRAVGRRPGSSPRGAGLPPAHITSSGGGGGGGGGKALLPVCPPPALPPAAARAGEALAFLGYF